MKQLFFIICLLLSIVSYADILKESSTIYTTQQIEDNTNNNILTIRKNSKSTDTVINNQVSSPTKTNTDMYKSTSPTNSSSWNLNESSTAVNESNVNIKSPFIESEEISLEELGDTSSKSKAESSTNIIDPHENFNRNAYRMNATLDKNFVRPAAVWYTDNVPGFFRAGAQNFFNNLRDFVTLGNDILQLNTYRSIKDTGRVFINSTIGILGLFDIAQYWGMPEHINTFGHTMRFYGWENSSYIVIPFLGPSTIRDALGMIPDTFFNPTWWIDYPYSNYISVGLFTVSNLDTRAKLLPFDQSLNTAIDPYSSIRDFYLQSTGNMPPSSNIANFSTPYPEINDDISSNSPSSSQLENLIDEK